VWSTSGMLSSRRQSDVASGARGGDVTGARAGDAVGETGSPRDETGGVMSR
jgi:hypothetical protein